MSDENNQEKEDNKNCLQEGICRSQVKKVFKSEENRLKYWQNKLKSISK